MKIGVIFPQLDIGPDAGSVRAYSQAVEDMGFNHLQIYDHILGADTSMRPNWAGAYRLEDQFHEVMVVFGYIAAITERIELVTGILILPQRETTLVAKQAAEVDVLSGGRLRLGVGIGWNAVEYEAAGQNFHNRGRRIEEQITVLRELWTRPSVHFEGRWHTIRHAGIKPLPIQRPIPIWIGGTADAVLDRVGRMADGWFPQSRLHPPSSEPMRAAIRRIYAAAQAAGRDPQSIGISGTMTISQGTPDDWLRTALEWKEAGADYISLNTMGAKLPAPDGHLPLLQRFLDEVAPAL